MWDHARGSVPQWSYFHHLHLQRSLRHAYMFPLNRGANPSEIWTHGSCFRFATINAGFVTTWEIGFTRTEVPTKVQSVPTPGDSNSTHYFSFYPNLSRLAFITGGRVKVSCVRDSRFLLDSVDAKWPRRMSISDDGRFFTCGTSGSDFYLWKESSTGYTLHRKLVSNTRGSKPLISPNGESIIAFGDSVVQLWRTADSTTSVQVSQRSKKSFILGFSRDEALAAFTRMGDETVTVLDLKLGTPRLVIDTDMKVHGLGVSGSTIIVVGEGKIVSWNLPTGDRVLHPRMNVHDSVRTTPFDHPPFPAFAPRPTTSMSSDLGRFAIVEGRGHTNSCLHLYSVPTGQCLASTPMELETSPWFTTEGCKIWCVADSGEAESWRIVGDGESDLTELEHQESTTQPPDGFPWRPSRNYSVTDGRWVLSSSRKRLLWLPPHWRSDGWNRMWGGRFLALLDHEQPEPVILELE